MVKSLSWSVDDLGLVSAGIDGAVYEWKLSDFSRKEEHVTRNVHYSCVVYNQVGDTAATLLQHCCNTAATLLQH